MDFDYFMDVVVHQKIIPWARWEKMTQTFDSSVLHLRPFVECDDVLKIRYINRQWVL